uniref:Alcohol oxidase n=1 Tax=Ganoderma boninense TaxID=34458 RepID=A0A5K1JV48_9APHY|nr:Alcohol oxidase [Ganoderma boninense]
MGQVLSQPPAGSARFIAALGPLPSGAPEEQYAYDYIIVGGGTAGCVLAARLSENPGVKVLLIEAGKNFYTALPTKIPFSFHEIFGTDLDWGTHTVPQKELSMKDTEVYWPRGRVLGGTRHVSLLLSHSLPSSSALKFNERIDLSSMLSICVDFDEWVALGAKGWSYKDLDPYFLKAEKFHPSSKHPEVNPADHGTSGPWETGFPSQTAPVNDYIIKACQTLGMRNIDDINAGQGSLGVTQLMGTLDSDGQNTTIQRLVFDTSGQAPRVIGVEMKTSEDAQIYSCWAKGEVILCAGTVGTPQLLMLSGVGPAEDLEKLDISVVKDMPAVGRNVIDHVSSGPIRFHTDPGLTYDYLNNFFWGSLASLRWRMCGTGPLSSMVYSSTAFVKSTDPRLPYYTDGRSGAPIDDHSSGPDAPDLELLWAPQAVFTEGSDVSNTGKGGVTFEAIALKPESRGSITLKSSDPSDPPNIDPQYLSTENDMNVPSGYHGRRDKADVASQGEVGLAPGACVARFSRLALTAFPFCGSPSAEDSVVDANLRVHGIDGLRCVDASVFPTQVSGHPCAVVVAMAEKAADMIKESAASST